MGVAVSDGDGGVEELLRRADLAMYAAKANGKRRLELYDASLERADAPTAPGRSGWFQSNDEQREEIISLLQDDDALTMAFQPIVDLRTGRVAGYEALARFATTPQRPPNAWFARRTAADSGTSSRRRPWPPRSACPDGRRGRT